MAYLEGEVIIPVEGFAAVDEGELEAGGELGQLDQIAAGTRMSWWPSGAAWILPLLVGGAVGAGLVYLGAVEDDGGPDDGVW